MIIVVVDHKENQPTAQSKEAIVFAQKIGAEFEKPVVAVVLAQDASAVCEAVKQYKLSRIIGFSDPRFGEADPEASVAALAELIQRETTSLVVTPNSSAGADFLPRLAARLKKPFISGCVGYEKIGESLVLTRPIFNSKLNIRLSPKGDGPCIVTTAPGAFPADEIQGGGSPEILMQQWDSSNVARRRSLIGRQDAPKGEVDLASAQVIVACGRGLKQKENIPVVQELADAFGGVVGASRPVVDAEWLPRDRQIGSSGQTVSPKLYIAVGISGAVQHLVGMQTARCIVAINRDPDAPIFKVAHYGIADDLMKVVPALSKLVREVRKI